MKSYHFSCERWTQGAVGFCARVNGQLQGGGAGQVAHAIRNGIGVAGEAGVAVADEDVEYVNFYVSPENVRQTDIDED